MSITTLKPISGITITLDTPLEQFETNMIYSGTINQNGSSFTICCKKLDDGLSFFIDTEKSGDISLEQLFVLAGAESANVPALSQIDLFENIKIDAFTTQFDPQGKGPTLVGFGIKVDETWQIIKDKLEITGVGLEMYYKHDKDSKSFTGAITGDLTLAKKDLEVALHLDASDEMELTIQAKSDQGLPDIGDVASLIDDNIGKTIHDTLHDIHLDAIVLQSIDVGFSPKEASLHYVNVHADVNLFNIPTEVSIMVPDLSILGKLKAGTELKTKDLLSKLSIEAPFLPELTIDKLELGANVKDKSFSFAIDCKENWALDLGGIKLELEDVATNFDYAMESKAFSGSISGQGQIDVFEIDLSADYQGKDTGLTFGGQMTAVNDEGKVNLVKLMDFFLPSLLEIPENLVDIEFSELDISIDQTGFELNADIETTIDFGIGSFDLKSFALYHHKQNDTTNFGLALTSDFKVSVAGIDVHVSGTLHITKDGANTKIEFTPDAAMPPISVPLPLPSKNDQPIKLDIALADIALSKDGDQGWAFNIACKLSYENMYKKVMNVLHNGMNATMTVNSKGVYLKIDEVINPIVIDVKSPVGDLDFGKISFNFTNISLDLADPLGIEAELDIALPQELNNMFGTSNGKPNVELFRVFDPTKPDNNAVKAKLIASDKGVGVNLLNSPFEAIQVEDGYWTCPLGKDAEYGEIKFELPQFDYDIDTMAFAGYGGMEVTKDIKIPMFLFKALLDGLGLKPIADLIPDAIPIEEIDIFDPKTKKINTHKLVDPFASKLPSEVEDLIHTLEDQADKLPDRLKDYLNIQLPKSFYFNINIKEDGDVSIAIDVNDLNPLAKTKTNNPPIKIWYPSIGAMGPALCGMEFYGFSFGEILSGTFFSCTIDYVSDVFYMIPIIVGMEIPEACRPYLSESREYQMTTTVKNLFMLIEYDTEVPIPIPLFFDDVGIDYYNIEGVKVSTHFGFPMPGLDFGELAKIIMNLYKFITDRKALMPTTAPEHFDLKFLIGRRTDAEEDKGNPIELALPKYLGGQALKINYTDISVYSAVAHFMNWCKTFSIDEIIQAIDIKYRIGKEHLDFFGLEAEIDWAITTPNEFREKAYTYLGLQKASPDIESVLAIVPQHPDKKTEGIVTFLKGEVGIANTLSLTSTFALALAGKGFATGFKMEGKINGLIDMMWAGSIGINLDDKSMPLFLDARIGMKVLGEDIVKGVLTLNDKGLYLDGKIDLFPGIELVKATGNVKGNISKNTFYLEGDISKSAFYLEGDIDLEAGGVTIIKEKAVLSDKGFSFSGQFLCVYTDFSLLEEKGAMVLKGDVGIDIDMRPTVGPIKIAGVEITPKISFDFKVHAALAMAIGKQGFAAGVTAGFHFKGLQRSFTATLKVAPSDVKHLAEALLTDLEHAVEKILTELYNDVGKYLEDVGKKVFTFAEDTGKAVGHALKDAYKKTAEETAKLMKDADMAANEVGHALQSAYNFTGDQAAKAMKDVGYAADQVAGALNNVYNFSADQVAVALKGANYAVSEVGKGLKSAFNLSTEGAAQALHYAKYGAREISSALKGTFTNSAQDVAKAFKAIGYGAGDVAGALKGVFTNSADEAGKALKAAGYNANQVAGAMKDVFNASAEAVAKFMQHAWGKSGKAVNDVLKGAGYATSEVESVMKSLFNWLPHIKIPYIKAPHVKAPHVKGW